MDTLFIVPPNPNWKSIFEKEKVLIESQFRINNPKIEHIGSTSIKELAAKPTIDIMVGFNNLTIKEIVSGMSELGYEFWKEDPFMEMRQFFIKWDSLKKERLFHLHVTQEGNDFWNEQLKFRDTLRENKYLRNEYEKLKKDLVEKFKNDRDGYTKGKTDFVNSVLKL